MTGSRLKDSFPPSSNSNKDDKDKGDGKILDPPTIESIAQLIKSGKANRIIVMTGAGISTAAGIPDFRTPGTGLYDNLQKYDLPYPEAIFDISYFKENPEPFFSLTRELYPGKFLPTLTHYFLTLLHRKKLLHRCFTQNIDTLERLAGLPDDIIVEAHGSFAKSKCLRCSIEADVKWMKEMVDKGGIPTCDSCKIGIVKPCITFFGESLPNNFFQKLKDFKTCDLLIVIGTSLQVQPFASLIDSVGEKTPRLLINLEKVGVIDFPDAEFGFDFDGKYQKYRRDAFYRGTCDEGVEKLAELCGFKDELLHIYNEGRASLIEEYGTIPTPIDVATKFEKKTEVEPKDEVEKILDQLAEEFEDKIKIKSEVEKEFDVSKEKKSDNEEILNDKEDIVKLDKKEQNLMDKDKENLVIELKDGVSNENKEIEEKKASEKKKLTEQSAL